MESMVPKIPIKIATASATLTCLAILTPVFSQNIILDQIGQDDGSGIGGDVYVCQSFESVYEIYDVIVIDNFVAYGESLNSIELVLEGWNGFTDPSTISGYSLNVYSSVEMASSNLIGDINFEYVDAADSEISTQWLGNGYLISIPLTIQLPFGQLFFGVLPFNEFSIGGQTGIKESLIGDSESSWIANPGGGWGLPSGMQQQTSDAAYRLFGTPCVDGNDCNSNKIDDCTDLSEGSSEDCNHNGIPDECDITSGFSFDINIDGVPDECQDCNENGVLDDLDIAKGYSFDCNENGIPDECEDDCNGNTIPDDCETFADCNENGIPDECEAFSDCNGNGVPDECETGNDCNTNGIPDECETGNDCNGNTIPDECDIANGTSNDIGNNGIPDECESDCNVNNVPDYWDIKTGYSDDCNSNGIPDECDLSSGNSNDCNDNSIPDECETDVNGNSIPDECECLADIVEDGYVNINDLLLLVAVWNTNTYYGDINYDGFVNVDDLIALIASWGPCE